MNERDLNAHTESSNHGFSVYDENRMFDMADVDELDWEWMKFGPLDSETDPEEEN